MEKNKVVDDRDPIEPVPSQEGSVEHVVRTGLPPGINLGDIKDPGKNAPKGPTHRS